MPCPRRECISETAKRCWLSECQAARQRQGADTLTPGSLPKTYPREETRGRGHNEAQPPCKNKGSQAHHACEPFFLYGTETAGSSTPLPIFPHVGKPDATCSIDFSHPWENVPQHALPADGKRTFAHSAIDRHGIKKDLRTCDVLQIRKSVSREMGGTLRDPASS